MKTQYLLPAFTLALLLISCGPGPNVAAEQTALVRINETASAEAISAVVATTTASAATKEASQGSSNPTLIALSLTESAQGRHAIFTETAQTFLDRIITIQQNGYISSTQGQYLTHTDFQRSFDQINWYRYFSTGFNPDNFVVRADVEWESASASANVNAGCGFVFREEDNDNYYGAWLTMDGYGNFRRMVNNRQATLGRSYYQRVDFPAGQAQFMLAVDGNKFTFYINDERVLTVEDNAISSGYLNFSIHSGINTSYGTRCSFTNFEIWQLAESN